MMIQKHYPRKRKIKKKKRRERKMKKINKQINVF